MEKKRKSEHKTNRKLGKDHQHIYGNISTQIDTYYLKIDFYRRNLSRCKSYLKNHRKPILIMLLANNR